MDYDYGEIARNIVKSFVCTPDYMTVSELLADYIGEYTEDQLNTVWDIICGIEVGITKFEPPYDQAVSGAKYWYYTQGGQDWDLEPDYVRQEYIDDTVGLIEKVFNIED